MTAPLTNGSNSNSGNKRPLLLVHHHPLQQHHHHHHPNNNNNSNNNNNIHHLPGWSSTPRLIVIFSVAVGLFVSIQVLSQSWLSRLSAAASSSFLPASITTTITTTRGRSSDNTKEQPGFFPWGKDTIASMVSSANNDANNNDMDDDMPRHHTVFSSSCNDQQHWESMVFFYHAYKVKQPGTVTRILSGCSEEEEMEQAEFFANYIQPLSPSFHIHFTPDFSKIKKGYGSYKYMNKPYGLKHWMEHGMLQMPNVEAENGIVILMDPDMILLRPLTYDFSQAENYLWVEEHPKTNKVRHGYPMAQQDGYLSNEWMNFNVTHIVGGGGDSDSDSDKEAPEPVPPYKDGMVHWNTGPPYLATVRDMYQIVLKWAEYVPRVLDVYPHLFAEMYGFVFATIQLKLPFTLIRSLVVSVTDTRREGWPFVDALPDDQICDPPKPGVKLPVILHYCERYLYGPNMFFSKYRIKKNIMDCDKPLLYEEPLVAGQYDYTVIPPAASSTDNNNNNNNQKRIWNPVQVKIKKPHVGKRDAFMLCALTRSINEALTHHKQVACLGRGRGAKPNFAKTYSIYEDPSKY